jgi:hypothetical protein
MLKYLRGSYKLYEYLHHNKSAGKRKTSSVGFRLKPKTELKERRAIRM